MSSTSPKPSKTLAPTKSYNVAKHADAVTRKESNKSGGVSAKSSMKGAKGKTC